MKNINKSFGILLSKCLIIFTIGLVSRVLVNYCWYIEKYIDYDNIISNLSCIIISIFVVMFDEFVGYFNLCNLNVFNLSSIRVMVSNIICGLKEDKMTLSFNDTQHIIEKRKKLNISNVCLMESNDISGTSSSDASSSSSSSRRSIGSSNISVHSNNISIRPGSVRSTGTSDGSVISWNSSDYSTECENENTPGKILGVSESRRKGLFRLFSHWLILEGNYFRKEIFIPVSDGKSMSLIFRGKDGFFGCRVDHVYVIYPNGNKGKSFYTIFLKDGGEFTSYREFKRDWIKNGNSHKYKLWATNSKVFDERERNIIYDLVKIRGVRRK